MRCYASPDTCQQLQEYERRFYAGAEVLNNTEYPRNTCKSCWLMAWHHPKSRSLPRSITVLIFFQPFEDLIHGDFRAMTEVPKLLRDLLSSFRSECLRRICLRQIGRYISPFIEEIPAVKIGGTKQFNRLLVPRFCHFYGFGTAHHHGAFVTSTQSPWSCTVTPAPFEPMVEGVQIPQIPAVQHSYPALWHGR